MTEIDHEIFRELRLTGPPLNKYVRNIIDVENNLFYMFDVLTGNILVTSTTSFIKPGYPQKFKVFEPRVKIFGKAKAIRVSKNNEQVAIMTDLGLYVVDLPHVWTSLMLPATCDKVIQCNSWMLDPEVMRLYKLFVYEVLQVRWHPCRVNHLLALYNDNFLRIIDTETKSMVKLLSLGRHPVTPLSTVIPLHENAVDFDFTTPSTKSDDTGNSEETEFLVVLLCGNGDVLTANINKDKPKVHGPLCLKAGSPKSYNISACSIAVLACRPPVVIIASNTGQVFHFLLLGKQERLYLQEFEQFEMGCGEECNQTQSPLIILKDPGSVYRYFMLHAAGIHAVMLPLISILDSFLTQPVGKDSEKKLRSAVKESESLIKYLVCTQMPGVNKIHPIYGVGLVPSLMATCHLVALQADTQATYLSVDAAFPPASVYTYKPFQKEQRKEFLEIISNYLLGSKSSRPPLLKIVEAGKHSTPEEILELLRNYLNIIKEDRIKKHTFVTEVTEAKIQCITIEYNCQLKQIESLKADKESLKRNAERIAEKYEERNDKDMELQRRIERFGLKISIPVQSIVEQKMKTELVTLKNRTDQLQTALLQAQALLEYKKAQELIPIKQQKKQKSIYLSESNRKSILQNLVAAGENMKEMKERLIRLKTKLNSATT